MTTTQRRRQGKRIAIELPRCTKDEAAAIAAAVERAVRREVKRAGLDPDDTAFYSTLFRPANWGSWPGGKIALSDDDK
ncbi:hypothetical protein [Kineosporia sp. R_H_3]|uniref:hypothetical protein n=1 Tax=Kineosporia sp. R_H_3 TaxID=1961848 RepID=UPI00117A4FE0|nr:hypothetical protein [Kineosporia sp. R_H_3]